MGEGKIPVNTRRIVSIAVFTALITVGGLISVYIPFTQVQLSFQVVFVIMAGLFLGGRDGALAVLVYIAMGLLGLPVFTQGGGISYVLMPSFGYLIGFPIGAFLSGYICSRYKKPTRGVAFGASLVGMIPIYVIGVAYQILILYYYTGTAMSAIVVGLPSIAVLAVKDGALVGLAAALYVPIRRATGLGRRQKRNYDASGVGLAQGK